MKNEQIKQLQGVLLNKKWKSAIDTLTDEEAGKLLKAIFQFATDDEEPALEGERLKLVFMMMAEDIEHRAERRAQKRQRPPREDILD